MDGRYFWIAQRLIDFLNVPSDSVDRLLADESVQIKISEFLSGEGSPRLSFYHQAHEPETSVDDVSHTVEPQIFLATAEEDRLTGNGLYFLRSVSRAVELSSIDTDIMTGSITGEILEHLETSLTSLYLPILATQEDWGKNPKENTQEFLFTLRRVSDVLKETVGSLHAGLDLQRPDRKYEVENKQPSFNRAAADPEFLAHYESVLDEWCRQVERLIQENDNVRKENDDSGPNSELEFWKARLAKLNSVAEQLKGKECKVVLGVCMAAKSKLLRRWKLLDNQITDATNEAKDNVKYLSTLEKYTEPLYTGSPSSIVDTLPALMNNVKMMHTIAKYYGTSERMTNLFAKITNQMITACKVCINAPGKLWDQDPNQLVQNMEMCLRLNEAYQEQYRLTKDKLLTQPKGRQFDFNEQTIFGKFDSFCTRLRKLIDVFSTVQQFSSLADDKIDGMELIIQQFDSIKQEYRSKTYDLLDSTKNIFDIDHRKFNTRIHDLESSLQTFINKSFETITNTEQALNLLKQFQAILQRENLKADLDGKYMNVFMNYGEDLEAVQRIYEKNKQNPLVVRNAPPVAGNISWARQLLRRIEEPMKKFQENKSVMASKEAKKIIKVYNRVARALIEFETLWYLAWVKSVDAAKSALQATLIIRHPDNGKLYVNFDREILQLIRETKWLLRFGIEIPEAARIVLLQEEKFKVYYDQLDYLLREYQRITSMVPPICHDILQSHLDEVERKLFPGMTSLTWTSMNIDGFLHRVHQSLSKFEELVVKVTDILEHRVEFNIKKVSRLTLIEFEEGTSYTLDQFVTSQDRIIQTRAVVMASKNKEVESSVDEVIELIKSSKLETTSGNYLVSDDDLEKFKSHYFRKMYLAILHCTRNSLNVLKKRIASRQSTGFLFLDKPFFDVDVELAVPNVCMNPGLDDIQRAINAVSISTLHSTKALPLWGQRENSSSVETFYDVIARDKAVVRMVLLLTGSIEGLKIQVHDFLATFQKYEYLWRNDIQAAYAEFLNSNPSLDEFEGEMKKYLTEEQHISGIPPIQVIGAISLHTQSLKYSLKAEAASWKAQYAKSLHKQAQDNLTAIHKYISDTSLALKREVQDLEDLRIVLEVIREVREKDTEADVQLGPVEETYSLLTRYEVRVPKEELEQVSNIRSTWRSLIQNATSVHENLMQLQVNFKRELIRSIKAFQVDVIQFRNDFDSNGPMIPGLKPSETIERLKFFQRMYDERERKWETYQSGEQLFGLPVAQYPELVRTKRELKALHFLYELYHDVNLTIKMWEDTLWSSIDLSAVLAKMSEFDGSLKRVPKPLRDWDTAREIRKALERIEVVLPILSSLGHKSIRPRHWHSILQLAGRTSGVDADQMTLGNILQANLEQQQEEIQLITQAAEKEEAIELRLRRIQEEWADQIFTFANFRDRGPIMLKVQETSEILQLLDETQMSLSSIMTSRYVSPFKEEVSGWVNKLALVSEVIEEILTVQSTWNYLEAVFTSGDIVRQLPQEAKRFSNIDKHWVKLMNKAFEVRNVLHVCLANDSIRAVLPHLSEQLELCQRSLGSYLEQKRAVFPNFYFVSDASLLEVLSQGSDPLAIQAHYKSIFETISAMSVATYKTEDGASVIDAALSPEGERLSFSPPIVAQGNVEEYLKQIEASSLQTVRSQCSKLADAHASASALDFATKYLGQVGLLGLQMQWTADVQTAVVKSKTEKNIMATTNKRINTIVTELVAATLGKQPPLERCKLEALITMQVHNRDAFDEVVRKKVKELYEFDWTRHLRAYWRPETESISICLADEDMAYGSEYVGCRERLVITPLTERCFISLSQSLSLKKAGAPTGPAGMGKTETIKDLGNILGKHVLTFNCSSQMDYKSMGRILKGLTQTGYWGCFGEFNRMDQVVLSVVAQQLQAVYDALREKRTHFVLPEGASVRLNQTMGIFFTLNTTIQAPQDLPENLKVLYRTIAMTTPDRMLIIRVRLAAAGFQDSINLARKMNVFYQACEQQLTKAAHYDFGLRSVLATLRSLGALKRSTPQTPTQESSIVVRMLRDCNISRLNSDDVPTFLSLLADTFPNIKADRVRSDELDMSVRKIVSDRGLSASADWVDKIHQIYETSLLRPGVILLGPAGCGKSAALDTLLSAMTEMGMPQKMIRMNPCSVSLGALFGFFEPSTGDWTDGILTSVWRKALKQRNLSTWIVVDGPLVPEWIEHLNTALDDNRTLTLANGDRLPLSQNIHIVFETDSVSQLSPVTTSRTGVVAFTESTVGWRGLLESWSKTRRPHEAAVVLTLAEQLVEPLASFIRSTSDVGLVPVTLSNQVATLIKILNSLVPDAADSDGVTETFMERAFIFALVWSVGGLVSPSERAAVDKFLRSVNESLPTFAQETVYGFCLDEGTGDWETWIQRLSKTANSTDAAVMSPFEVFTHTPETTRVQYLLECLQEKGYRTMLVGAGDVGKTRTVTNHLVRRNMESRCSRTIALSAFSGSSQLQQSIEALLDRRQGKVFGPAGGKTMTLLVDDLHTAACNAWGDRPAHELLRQLIEDSGFFSADKLGEFAQILDVDLVACLGVCMDGSMPVSARLCRHFVPIRMDQPVDDELDQIFSHLVRTAFPSNRPAELRRMLDQYARATVKVVRSLAGKLKPSPSQPHYGGNMRNISRILLSLSMVDSSLLEGTEGPATLLRLWACQCARELCDGATSLEDAGHVQSAIKAAATLIWGEEGNAATSVIPWLARYSESTPLSSSLLAASVAGNSGGALLAGASSTPRPQSGKMTQSGIMSMPSVEDGEVDALEAASYKLLPDPIAYVDDVEQALRQYNSAGTQGTMNITFFDTVVEDVLKLVHVLSKPRGNAVLVGVGGSGKRSLTRLAAYICRQECVAVSLDKSFGLSNMLETLRQLMKHAGLGGRHYTLLISEQSLKDDSFYDAINSFLLQGEIPGMFTRDELDNIVGELRSGAKKLHPGFVDSWENLYKLFVDRARDRIHVVVCLSSLGDGFRTQVLRFPGLLKGASTIWYPEWSRQTLELVASSLIHKYDLQMDAQLRKEVAGFMSAVHHSSGALALEYAAKQQRQVYVTSKTYLSFVRHFYTIYTTRYTEQEAHMRRILIGLDKLKQAEADVERLKNELLEKEKSLVEAQKMSTKLLADITEKTAKAEKKKGEVLVVRNELAAEVERINQERAVCEKDLLAARPPLDEAIQVVKSIQPKDVQNLKALRNPPDLIKRIFDCVLILFHQPLNSVEAVEIKGSLYFKDTYQQAQILMTNPGFLTDILNFPRDQLTDEQVELMEPYLDSDDFNFHEARKAFGNVGALCKWVRAMAEYHSVSKIVRPKMVALEASEIRVRIANQNLQGAVAELEKSQHELDQMQLEFEAAMADKRKIQETTEATKTRVAAANDLIIGLLSERQRWGIYSTSAAERRARLVGDSAIVAAFTCYAGPFNQEYREILLKQHIMRECLEHKLSYTDNTSVVQLLATDVTIGRWLLQGLPNDSQSIENAAIMSQKVRSPLLVDPQAQALAWIRSVSEAGEVRFASLSDKSFLNVLEECLSAGRKLVVEGITEELDPVIGAVLERNLVHTARTTRLVLPDKEVDYHETFEIVLISKDANPKFAADVYARASVIDFSLAQNGLEAQLLSRLLHKEKPELEEQRHSLLEETNGLQQKVSNVESELLEMLSDSQGNLLEDSDLVEILAKTKKACQEINEKLEYMAESEKRINNAREEFRPVATRGAILYYLLLDISTLCSLYQMSMQQFLYLFDQAVKSAERSTNVAKRTVNVMESLTFTIHAFVSRGLLDNHRKAWLFLLATRIGIHAGAVTPAELNAFLRTSYAPELKGVGAAGGAMAGVANVMGGAVGVGMNPGGAGQGRKKPFEWLSDASWLGLTMLGNLPNFDNVCDMITRNEAFWKNWLDNDAPEEAKVPDLDERLTAFQRLLLVRALREDRTFHASAEFVRATLGRRFVGSLPLDMDQVYADSSSRRPILFVLTSGTEPTPLVMELAKRRQKVVRVLSVGQGQDASNRRALLHEFAAGNWVLLQNGHTNPRFLQELDSLLARSKDMSDEFRLFLTAAPTPKFPVSLAQICVRVAVEPIQGLKATVRKLYSMIDQETIDCCVLPEWRPCLYTCAMIHAVVQERRKFGPAGFSGVYEFALSDFASALRFLRGHFTECESKRLPVSWSLVKYMLCEVIYGGSLLDEYDRRILWTYAETWLSKKGCEPGASLGHAAYVAPKFADLARVRQILDDMPNNDHPDVFGLQLNADLAYRVAQVRATMLLLSDMQPRERPQIPVSAKEEMVQRFCEDMMTKLPADFSMEEVKDKINKKLGGPRPLNLFLLSEIEKFQTLLSTVRSSISAAKAALGSNLSLDSPLTLLMEAIAESRVPSSWLRISWPSSALSLWVLGFTQRYEQLNNWLNNGRPATFWMAGFFNPQAFLVGMKQEVLKRHPGWALDDVVFVSEVMAKEREEIKTGPEEGVFVHGLFMDGAAWDKKANRIVDTPPRTAYSPLPVVFISAVSVTEPRKDQITYMCPCYRNPSRGASNLLLELELRCEEEPSKWVQRGVAVVAAQ
eukprot:TRINITY_DN428_c1_g1_i1.p1 TRINITY_DN428_c1_g1~~TRINITY_DN428_c1_g1_i1.p1  ORF type:complete len:4548 (+),score=958.95 TRINITY_DN428_c1_g1_i1:229-13872(+)